MEWNEYVDLYCERQVQGFMGEPVNAVTNLAFIAASIWLLTKIKGDRPAQFLVIMIGVIGTCSGLFHILANRWSAMADSFSILVFILVYLYFAIQRVLQKDKAIALLGTFLFIPYSIVIERVMNAAVGSLNGSVSYVPVTLLIIIFGAISGDPQTRREFWMGAGLLAISLAFRSIDEFVCGLVPFGTHFLWHILNAIVLSIMVISLHRNQDSVAKTGS